MVVEVVAMPLGRIQAAARLSDDLQHSQHFLGRSLDHQRSLAAAWIEDRFAAHDDTRRMRKLPDGQNQCWISHMTLYKPCVSYVFCLFFLSYVFCLFFLSYVFSLFFLSYFFYLFV